MVGVPGKFTGCETCRLKRIKCGNEKPICKKCITTGRHCQGYERPRKFVIGTQEDEGRVTTHDRRLIGPARPNASTSALRSTRMNNRHPLRTTPPTSPLIRLSDASLNEIQVLALQTDILTLEPLYTSNNGPSTLPALLNFLPDLTKSSPALDYALRALCLIHMGVTKKEPKFVKQSAHINVQALAKVRRAILSPSTASRIETLAASMCLYLYEQVACTREKGAAWRFLFNGSCALVQHRGPASYKDFPDHHFFVRLFRNDACFDALSRCMSTFLSEPEWLTVPWEDIPKSAMDRLFDIQFLLPAIFERVGKLEKELPSTIRRLEAKELFDRCMNIAKMFDDWYDDLHAHSKVPLFRSIPRQPHKEDPVKKLGFDMCFLFSNYLQFVDLNIAFLHIYYWAALTLFYRKIQIIHRLLDEDILEQSRDSPDSYITRLTSASPPTLHVSYFNTNNPLLLTPPTEQLSPNYSSFFQITSSEPITTTFPVNPVFGTPDSDQVPLLSPKYSEDSVTSMAYLICKSLPYALNRTLHSLGPDHSAWPIWCALQVFKRQKHVNELAWCTKMLEMWDREGWKFGFQMGMVEWG